MGHLQVRIRAKFPLVANPRILSQATLQECGIGFRPLDFLKTLLFSSNLLPCKPKSFWVVEPNPYSLVKSVCVCVSLSFSLYCADVG
jgi:hypothetical protein